ncbi:MAG: ComEA family DNA-binding protein [Woeseiaceae bacterium]|jgi:competence protein ComEA|nr:ComEA family DNA-binding protein [Woeseiaceae bacterium]
MHIRKLLAGLAIACLPLMALAGPVNINKADAETISSELKGIGPSKARAIVEYREKYGPFKSLEDLTLVSGIGARTLELNEGDIRLDSPSSK